MFFSHAPELIGLLLVALLVFGPKKLPEIGAGLGKGIRDFKQSVSGDDQSSPVISPGDSR